MGSLLKTQSHLDMMKEQFNMRLMQKDVTGTEHWEVSGEKKRR